MRIRYTVKDHYTNKKFTYTQFEWNIAFFIQFLLGGLAGFILAVNIVL